MPINKLALIRYKTIDSCLRNRGRKWTLEDLMDEVSDALYELEGIDSGISKRTLQLDLQTMRSEKLGYNAPIVVIDKKYYTYEDPKYTISNVPISDGDMDKMKEIVDVLKQLNGFNYFDEMSDMIARLEDNIYKSKYKSRNFIQFEDNKRLKGIELISPLYKCVRNKTSLEIEYQSFKAKTPSSAIYYPYLLKEYRNRWFLIVKNKKNLLMTLALDRIIAFKELPEENFVDTYDVDFETYYDDLIGVTKTIVDKTSKVVLFINKENAPYVITKPLHATQVLEQENEEGIIISLDVVLNFELEREILGFGESMKVLSPRLLVKKIKRRIEKMQFAYNDDLNKE